MDLTKRELRVINAFLNCIRNGEFTIDYSIILLEDTQRYGWLSDVAKDYFYDNLPSEQEEEPAEEVAEES